MKISIARFTYRDRSHGTIHVTFRYDDKGKPLDVEIRADGKLFRVDNPKSDWKPCVTHCQDLIRLKLGRKPKTPFAERRIKDTKPALRIAQGTR